MNIKTHLSLGRVSNLPTVWTNVLAAGAVAGAGASLSGWIPLVIAMSLFYVAGMYYNDVCDADYDEQHQSFRPIPSGLISRETAEAYACLYALIGLLLVYGARMTAPMAQGSGSVGWLVSALSLLVLIVLYNRHHKGNPLSPLLMAGCRVAVLLTASLTLGAQVPLVLMVAIACMLSWLIGLTYLAKHEQGVQLSVRTLTQCWPIVLLLLPVVPALMLATSSPSVLIPLIFLVAVVATSGTRLVNGPPERKGSAIALMIAGICLIDGLFIAWVWGLPGALISIAAFGLTLVFQRWIAGT